MEKNLDDFFSTLKKHIKGDLHCDPFFCNIYSIDASIYEIQPLGVVIPRDKQDIINTLEIADKFNIPVIPRGAATGIAGGCLGSGLIIDTSKYLDRIIEINIEEEYAIVEPGVIQDSLNNALNSFGYRLGPDTSTGNRATLGGMLANNSAGARSLIYGSMVESVLEVELALIGGTVLRCPNLTPDQLEKKQAQKDTEGEIYKKIIKTIALHKGKIEKHFPKIPRHVSGYNLDLILKKPLFNLSTLIAGSEGTLGIATEIKIKIVKKTNFNALCLIHIKDLIEGLKSIEILLSHSPVALEMIDADIIRSAKNAPSVKNKLGWLKGDPEAIFIAEFYGDSFEEVEEKLKKFSFLLEKENIGYGITCLTEKKQINDVTDVRKAGLGLLLSKRSYSRAIAFIEDISIAPTKLASFIKEFKAYLKSIGKEAGIYGHIGSGCMHIRPYIDLRKTDEVALMTRIINTVSNMVLAYEGSMSGEHGDGLVRSWLNRKMFGPEIYQAFVDIKTAFDKKNLMNPCKIVNGQPFTDNLKPIHEVNRLKTFLDFSQEGGFELAADLCNGNGECRKKENVMCPSFQATGDEYDSTRARAQSLKSIIHGKMAKTEFTGKHLYDILDLCIECKGCKKECPSQVDMAKMKSEFLYQYQEKNGVSLRNKFFGNIHWINKLTFPFSKIFNFLSSHKLLNIPLAIFGITPKRALPLFAKEKFSTWVSLQPQIEKEKKVALFNDTYTEFNEPSIGKAAFSVLQALGFQVILIHNLCCGRPLISKGLLKEAKKNGLFVTEKLNSFIDKGIKIIALEPSCLSAFRDDFKGLLGQDFFSSPLIKNFYSFEEFLQEQMQNGKVPIAFSSEKKEIFVHGHCHQKALVGMNPTLEVLNGIEGFIVKEIESGCCGMAGSFGYEKEHYTLSMKIGELKLFPKVRSLDSSAWVIASGVSCRHQITHGTNKRPLHLAEAIAMKIEKSI